MHHQRTEYDVEPRVGKLKRLYDAGSEVDLDSGAPGLGHRSRDHLGRRIDAVDAAARAHTTFGNDRERSSPAADVQHSLTGLETGVLDQLLTKPSLPAEREQPDERVVAGRPVDYASGRAPLR